MITEVDLLRAFRNDLSRKLAERIQVPRPDPLTATPWIAMSVMQKAIRRGQVELALRASATLILNTPDRFWRRCACIAFEDIGLADIGTMSLIASALGGKRVRGPLGDEWAVASILVEIAAAARKCRAADDLLMSIERSPRLADCRSGYPAMSDTELQHLIVYGENTQKRGAALWFLLGTHVRPSKYLARRTGDPALVFDVLIQMGVPDTLIAVLREGFRRTREVLCPFVGLLSVTEGWRSGDVDDDPLPSEGTTNSIPMWALDQYTREGRAAVSRFLQEDCPSTHAIRALVPANRRLDVACSLVFRAEGGLLARRLRWNVANALRQQVDLECHGLNSDHASQLLNLLLADLPVLNTARATVMRSARYAA